MLEKDRKKTCGKCTLKNKSRDTRSYSSSYRILKVLWHQNFVCIFGMYASVRTGIGTSTVFLYFYVVPLILCSIFSS